MLVNVNSDIFEYMPTLETSMTYVSAILRNNTFFGRKVGLGLMSFEIENC